MRTLAATLGASVLVLLTAGCGDFGAFDVNGPSRTIGSGQFVTETRAVQGFSSINVSIGARAIVTLGSAESLEITAEDNILPLIESTVVNGQLTFGLKPHAGSISTGAITYRIHARDINAIVGSSAAQIEMHGINTPSLVVVLSSAASFTGSGVVDRFDLDMSSASRVQASQLASRAVDARLSSASNALLRVGERLVASASSAAVLEYVGDPPVVQAQTSSGASVRRVGP